MQKIRNLRATKSLRTVGDVSVCFGLTPRAVRYYDSFGLVRPQRDAKGVRVFDHDDCTRLAIIARLRVAGLSLSTIETILQEPGRPVSDAWRVEACKALNAHSAVLDKQMAETARLLGELASEDSKAAAAAA